MSYRIEISPSGRAGCQVSACKKEGKKIAKGELRLGSWVEYREQDRGGWQWRHWGCVSGEQVVHIQQKIGKDSNGEYRWDAIDGWEDLEDRPDIREKIKRVIRQGHIDPEDFNGDPEMNVPGQKGIHRRQKKTKTEPEAEPASGEEVKDGNKDEAEREQKGAKKSKKAGSKRHRGKTEVEDEEADEPEPKRPRKATGKRGREEKHEPDENADEPAPPVKKAKRASKKDSMPEPAAKPENSKKAAGKGKGGARGSAALKEESEPELPPEPTPEKPKKEGRGKRAAKVAVKEESDGVSGAEPEPEPEPAKKKASRSKKVKKEASASPEPDTKSGAGVASTSAPKSGASKPGKEEEEERGEENTAAKTKKGRKGSEKKSVPMLKGRARKAAV
ncbi:hypothetical protein MYCTH_2297494 [Thermothelomyces thermophilus ATCC 42464]|uniref:PARP-type domain-containing protein n=1 Tax=Thermothelomyces thermophilus (strain ATCC 42464 / BCRC 31852 / DSM 1799) TaxID=573729 RepID=G2Q602_THET4|nr:uncharacterized protein MYCTH_2297494 [Thermothelomyces thermophilus ATCC 42464]AEO54679.1 hypothetical protein MYCTH_2297494 [Thermothelomyces thermophilus ATCC 42464]